ncbi:hypothetical protein B0H14DRAFT_3886650 [Mycena olivaceomarginata]|nr:hypothetical protein B0H14DRAFT_3886650 [Mycena olivaceomarginata]
MPQYSPRPPCTRVCAAHLASASLYHLPFPLRVRRVHPHCRPPTAPTPRIRGRCRFLSQMPRPPAIRDGSRARVWRFESRIWMGSRWIGRCGAAAHACRPSPAAVGEEGRTTGAMEAPAIERQRDAPMPSRVGRSSRPEEGLAWGILVRLAWGRKYGVYLCVGAQSSHLPLGSHRIAFFHVSSTHS